MKRYTFGNQSKTLMEKTAAYKGVLMTLQNKNFNVVIRCPKFSQSYYYFYYTQVHSSKESSQTHWDLIPSITNFIRELSHELPNDLRLTILKVH